ncbi:hypothetical protein FQN50_004917 [Emmonsiellopsis sp. PD_5]|nr:hypothetical protein FQN50_004917 [Emmonsiellopsis sp. PD_5]
MAQSPPPALDSPPKESPADKKTSTELSQDLDTLLIRYLNLLDEQQRLQEAIGRHFSSGFFSLARANNSCPPGRRYGADYYDERMKATRKMSVESLLPLITPHLSGSPTFEPPSRINSTGIYASNLSRLYSSITPPPPLPPANQSPLSSTASPSFTTITPPAPELPPAPTTPKPTEEETENTTPPSSPPSASSPPPSSSPSPSPPDTDTPPPKPRNPLTWFGILTPQPLRSAQQSFTIAVDGPIPALAGVVGEMRAVEREIGRVRGLLGAFAESSV